VNRPAADPPGCRFYQRPGRDFTIGSVFIGVPIIFLPGATPRALLLRQESTPENPIFTGRVHFRDAWLRATDAQRRPGFPILARAKLRPVVVLRRGNDQDDPLHAGDVWVLPRYTEHDAPDSRPLRPDRAPPDLPNRFPLPACPRFSLDEDGHLDYFQATLISRPILGTGRHVCDLVPDVAVALLAKFATCITGRPPAEATAPP